jgi:hypothetical protein
MVRIGEVDGHAGLLFEAFPVTEFGAVIERESLAFLLWNASEMLKRQRGKELCVHPGKQESDEIAGSSVNKRSDTHAFVPTHEGVALEIADFATPLDNSWSFIDTPFFPFFSGCFSDPRASPSAVPAFLRSKVLLQMRRSFIDISIDGACGDGSSFSLEKAKERMAD